jgi:hypothetical protein
MQTFIDKESDKINSKATDKLIDLQNENINLQRKYFNLKIKYYKLCDIMKNQVNPCYELEGTTSDEETINEEKQNIQKQKILVQ